MRTLNLGNQLLSTKLRDLFATRYDEVVALHRCPEVFSSEISWQAGRADAWEAEVADETSRALAAAPVPHGGGQPTTVRMARKGGRLVGGKYSRRRQLAHWARWKTPAKRYFSASERAAARAQFATVLSCRDVVYNPAGELMDGGRPVSRLFELALARRAGHPYAVVNFTYEAEAEMRHLTSDVFAGADVVFTRERTSADRLVRDGVPAARVSVVPDAAFLFAPPVPGAGGRGVAISVNSRLDSAERRTWGELVAGFLAAGRRVEFVSNEHDIDVGFATELGHELGQELPVGPDLLDFDEYTAYLGGFDLVITSRFHTGVMASLVGRPVIGVEGSSRRLREGLAGVIPDGQLLGTGPGLVAAVRSVAEEALAATPASVAEVRERIAQAYTGAFPLRGGS